MIVRVIIHVTLLLIWFCSELSLAQVLPRGVGAYSFGYRKLDASAEYFDSSSQLRPAGDKFYTEFSAPSMANGSAGNRLKMLYDEMRKFDSQNANSALADEANFGELNGNVTTDIQGQFFGLGYGLTDDWTIYLGIPLVSAEIHTDLTYSGENNALALKQRLGALAYKELQEGLDQAAALNAQSIKENIEISKGYESIDHWKYTGLGDVFIGAKTEFAGQRREGKRFSLGLSGQLDLATGHSDDPDILTDLEIGRGYHAISVAGDGRLTFEYVRFGILPSVSQGIGRDVVRRVPESDESLVEMDRKAKVSWRPGQDLGLAIYSTVGNSLLRGTYTLGSKRHLRDSYSGSLEGNYDQLAKESEKQAIYHEVSFVLTTARAFANQKFAFPFVVSIAAHDTLSGSNAAREKYIELSLTSFFSTPYVGSKVESKGTPRSKRS